MRALDGASYRRAVDQAVVPAVVALTVVGGALRFATVDRQSFWLDELVTVRLLHRPFTSMLGQIPSSEATPYLYYVAAWLWTRVFGFGEAGVRSLSALVGTATVPVAYAAGAAFVSRRAGLIAAALVAVNPFLVWYSQEARAYAMLTFFAALSVLFLGRALRREARSRFGWAVASSIGIATHYFAVFLVAAEAVTLAVRTRPRRAALVAALLPAGVFLAHVPLLLRQRTSGSSVSQSPLTSRAAGIPKDLVVGYSFPAELAGSLIAAALVALGVALLVARTPRPVRRDAYVAGLLVLAGVLVPLALAAVGADYVIARNMIGVVVPAAVCVAAGYSSGRIGGIAAAALCALSVAIVVSVSADLRYGRTDWRGAARAIGPPSGTRAIVVTPDIDAPLWSQYVSALHDARAARVDEIDVVGLATQGGFSTGAVEPPEGPPKSAPRGFRLVMSRRTSTFAFARYRSKGVAAAISKAALAKLALAAGEPGLFLQGPASR